MRSNSDNFTKDSVALLRRLIATPRVSRDEHAAADILEEALISFGLMPRRHKNNIWVEGSVQRTDRPTLLLNAHIDTVRPVASWTRDPHEACIEGDRLYGIGSNDCGGGLVSLLAVFRELHSRIDLPYNLIYLASAEEEVSGADGIAAVLPLLPDIDVAIVGEPTGLQPAVAEKGLMVIDGFAEGKSGHAARGEGINAIYRALDDLLFLRDYRFERISPLLGPTLMQVTVVEAGTQHNVVPDRLHFVIDVRTNELYTNEEVHQFLQSRMQHSQLKARSYRLSSSAIAMDHPLVKRCLDLGLTPFGSPTLSDQALMRFPSLKLGPGESSRSHTADEFICLSEIGNAVNLYRALISEE